MTQAVTEAPTAVVFGRPVLPPAEEGRAPYWRLSLRAISQLAFQTNEVTAVIFIIAVASYGWVADQWQQVALLVIGAFVGTAGALVTTSALGTKSGLPMQIGLYGFNSCLIGLALGNFFAVNAALWIWTIVLAGLIGALTAAGDKFIPFPILATPFIIPFWIMYALDERVGLDKIELPPWETGGEIFYLQSAVASVGSSLFAGVLIAGIFYLVGATLSNWRHALVALLGGLIGSAVAALFEAPSQAILTGFTGFNAVLAALGIYVMCGEDLRLAVSGAVLSTLLMAVVIETGLQPLASGFVLATWLIMFLGWFQPRYWGPDPKADLENEAYRENG